MDTPARIDRNAPLARLHQAGKRYGTIHALDGLDLELHAGQVLALLGPNGAGKTTAVGLLLGLQAADEGSVELFGLPPSSLRARRRTGVMLQTAGIPDTLKVRELVALTRSYYPDPRSVDECLAMAGLRELAERRYGQLSGGQQRRVQFAMAVCGRPQLLFLDEPTTGLDIDARQAMWRAIGELSAQGCGVLLTTHYLEEAQELCDQIAIVNRGEVVACEPTSTLLQRLDTRNVVVTPAEPLMVAPDLPGLETRARTGGAFQVTYRTGQSSVEQELAAVRATGLHIKDIATEDPDLEDVFVSLTTNQGA